ncbi:E3 ubiquitin-protein ligase NLA isoform X1 [Coffea arabica]|uniref:E3 ubiquitin-protein ligase BAH1-like isoform X1 n=2 Tax=Coffea arabica TaxID=13443 RepID=A0A6P6WAS1_COFAR|nr:E3 ubiquitin-protein ligase BAH1-like isoform X1 [Coffea arabica]
MAKYLKTLLASGFRKYFVICINRVREKHAALALESNASTSSDISTKAMGEVLRKYDKVHGSINNLKCQNVQLEDLKNPCLCELMAWHINVKEKKNKTTIPGLLDDCKLQISEGRFSISASLSNSRVLDVDLTCSICLEALFDPVSLTCSHMFCYMCACSAGSVSTIDGIKAADSKSKCPLCRKNGVFSGAMRMSQLSILLRRKLPEYWDERRQKERKARLEEAKEYWQLQCRAFVGID